MFTIAPPADRITTRCADAALVCFAVFVFGVALMHLLRADHGVSTSMLGEYAVGPWGGVMTIAFASASLGCLMLALGLARSRPGSVVGWCTTGLFAVASMAFAVITAHPIDLPGAPSTTAGNIHRISFLVNIASIVLAAVLTAVIALRDARWREHRVLGAALALLLILAVGVQFKILHRGMPSGVANRFVVGAMMVWFVVTAIRLRRVTRPTRR